MPTMRAFAITFLAKTRKDSQLKLIKDNLAIPENKWTFDNQRDLLIGQSCTLRQMSPNKRLSSQWIVELLELNKFILPFEHNDASAFSFINQTEIYIILLQDLCT